MRHQTTTPHLKSCATTAASCWSAAYAVVGMDGGPHETERHYTVGGSYQSEGGTVPNCSDRENQGAC